VGKFRTLGDPSLEEEALSVVDFLRAMRDKTDPRWLTLLGGSGVGKTHWAHFVTEYAERLLAPYDFVVADSQFHEWPSVVDELRSQNYGIVDELIRCKFLALDDLGAECISNFGTEKLFRILNARLNKWTMITGNLTAAWLSKVDSRLLSRMLRGDNVVMEILTVDYAMREKSWQSK
jgi:DNA replication protein DnaC